MCILVKREPWLGQYLEPMYIYIITNKQKNTAKCTGLAPIEQSISIFTRGDTDALAELIAGCDGVGEVHPTITSALAADIPELLHVL